MIDLEKLQRIEERHADLADSVRVLFGRYRARVDGARAKWRLAVVSAADERIQGLHLAGLAEYTNDQLQAFGVNVELLESARREQQLAQTMFVEYQKRQREANASGTLLHVLQVHANTHEGVAWQAAN